MDRTTWVPILNFPLNKDAQKMTHVSSTECHTSCLWSVPSGSDNELVLSQMVEWKFQSLNKAFKQAVTQTSGTLLLYSDVVNSNIVGGCVASFSTRSLLPMKWCGHYVFRTSTHPMVTITSLVFGHDQSQFG